MIISKQRSVGFQDVNLLSTKPFTLKSRSEITVPLERIIVAPMSALQSKEFIQSAIALGLSVPIHRYTTCTEQWSLLETALKTKTLMGTNSLIWLSAGLNDYKQRIEPVLSVLKENNVGVLIDVANGFMETIRHAVKDIGKYDLPNLMAGNINSSEGFNYLIDAGVRFVRCGISGGSACDTYKQTGVGNGQISLINNICENRLDGEIICDGGIKTPGDVAKAHGAGADYVMLGGMLAKAVEAQCNRDGTGIFFGGASAMAKEINGLNVDYIEGKEVKITEELQPLASIVNNLVDGLRSSISYTGHNSLESFINNGVFELKL